MRSELDFYLACFVALAVAILVFVRTVQLLLAEVGDGSRAHWLDRRAMRGLLGIVLPLACIVFDPGVLRPTGSFGFTRLLAEGRPLVYATFAIGALALFASRPAGPWRRGIHYACGLLGVALGVLMLPVSLLGLYFYGLGLLGLVPFLVAAVHLRAARVEGRSGFESSRWGAPFVPAGVSFVVVSILAIQYATSRLAERACERASDSSVVFTSDDERILAVLLLIAPPSSSDVFLDRYGELASREESHPDLEEIQARYLRLTGKTIQDRRYELD